MLSNLRPITRKCVYLVIWSLLVTWQRLWSHHSIRHSQKNHDIRKPRGSIFNRSHWAIEIEIIHCGNRDFLLLLLWLWPWPYDLQIRTWSVLPGGTLSVLIWSSYVKVFESYRLTNTGTYMHTYTDRQRDRHDTRPKLYTMPLCRWSIKRKSYVSTFCDNICISALTFFNTVEAYTLIDDKTFLELKIICKCYCQNTANAVLFWLFHVFCISLSELYCLFLRNNCRSQTVHAHICNKI